MSKGQKKSKNSRTKESRESKFDRVEASCDKSMGDREHSHLIKNTYIIGENKSSKEKMKNIIEGEKFTLNGKSVCSIEKGQFKCDIEEPKNPVEDMKRRLKNINSMLDNYNYYL